MVPLKLVVSGFLSYREKVEIDFTALDLVCISGPNGAGKSSLLDAITWALFGKARRDDKSIIHLHPSVSAAEVTFYFEYEGNIYRVYRSLPRNRTTTLEFHILMDPSSYWNDADQPSKWKPLTERSKTDTENRIKKVLSMDYDTFINASFFLQGKADQFSRQTSGQRKQILINILGLDVWETYLERVKERRRTIKTEVDSIDARLQEIEQELKEESARKTQLQKIAEDLANLEKTRAAKENQLQSVLQIVQLLKEKRKRLQTIQSQMEQITNTLNEWQKRLEEIQEEQRKFQQLIERASEIRNAYAAWEKTRQELEHWNQLATRHYEVEKLRAPLLTQLAAEKARLEQELQNYQDQQTAIKQQTDQLLELQNRTAVLEDQINQLQAALEKRPQLEQQRLDAHNQQAELKAENLRLKAEMAELRNRIEQILQEEDAPCPFCGKPLPKAEREALVATLTDQGKQKGDQYRMNKDQIEMLNQQENEIQAKLKQCEEDEKTLTKIQQQRIYLQKEQEAIRELIAKWEQIQQPKMNTVIQLLQQEAYLPQVREQLTELDRQLKALGYDIEAHEALRKAEADGQACLQYVQLLEKAHTALEQLEKQRTDIEANIAQRTAELANLQTDFTDLAASLAAEEAQLPVLEQIEDEVFRLKEEENQLRMAFGSAQQRVAVLEERRKQQAFYQSEKQQKLKLITLCEQLEQAFGKNGIPALLIEQALPVIEEKANNLLSRLSEGSMFIRFITQRPYQSRQRSDELKDTLDIQITDTLGSREYEMYSGGEAFRVDFAIRLALSELLAQRAGARLQTLVIDEGFGSQDSGGRQRLLEAIHAIRDDFSKILVISHVDEIKEAFPNRLEIEKTNNGSKVVSII